MLPLAANHDRSRLKQQELEAQQDLFHSFDDTHSGVLKKAPRG